MAQRPDVAALIAWMQIQSDAEEGDGSPIDTVLSAVRESIERRCSNRLPVDYAEPEATDYPVLVRQAILIGARNIYQRRTAPGGMAGVGNLAAVAHILGQDVDVETLLSSYLNLDGFA